jgi:hypothetical protein
VARGKNEQTNAGSRAHTPAWLGGPLELSVRWTIKHRAWRLENLAPRLRALQQEETRHQSQQQQQHEVAHPAPKAQE